MPVLNGIKYSCEPCMRGHRSTKCTHNDRILLQVRRPGRPLTSCPHTDAVCNCALVKMAIPKASSCACSKDESNGAAASTASTSVAPSAQGEHSLNTSKSPPSNPSNRVDKSRRRKSSIKFTTIKTIQNMTSAELQDEQSQQHPDPVPGPSPTPSSDNIDDAPESSLGLKNGASEGHHLEYNHSSGPFGVLNWTEDVPLSSRAADAATTLKDTPKREPEIDSAEPITKSSCCGGTKNDSTPSITADHHQVVPPTTAPQTGRLKELPSAFQSNPAAYHPQSASTYNFPSSYSTFQHPLTPEELAFLQKNSHLFSPQLRPLAFGGAPSELGLASDLQKSSTPHNCNCGPACNCLGCAAHPYNSRTMSFVQSLNQIMEDATPLADPPGNGFPYVQSHPSFDLGSGSGQPHGTAEEVYDSSWSTAPTPFTTSDQRTSLTAPTPTSAPSESESMESGRGDVSASDFFHVDYPSGHCGEEANVCFCGDGCTCVGCLVHSRRAEENLIQATVPLSLVTGELAGGTDLGNGDLQQQAPWPS